MLCVVLWGGTGGLSLVCCGIGLAADAPATMAAEVRCETCLSDIAAEDSTTMDCGHTFCNSCWGQYFTINITEGKSRLRCMAYKCGAVCPETKIKAILHDKPLIVERYDRSLTESYVNDNKQVRWCPSVPHCGSAIQVDGELLCEPECSCGLSFCFSCGLEAHSPCPCDMCDPRIAANCPPNTHARASFVFPVTVTAYTLSHAAVPWKGCCDLFSVRKASCERLVSQISGGGASWFHRWKMWLKKSRDDSETAHWMTANTKGCPKCGKPVEKNGGCNLVVCMCGQAFCWLCGAATKRAHTWTQIYGHECGRWKEDLDADRDSAQRQLERYVHYHTRWKAHMDSLAMEKRQGKWFSTIKDKLKKMETNDEELNDYTWLHQALDQLLEARRVLGYSYAFAFFMFGDMYKDHISKSQNTVNQNLFEDQQQQLESEVERLSGMVQDLDQKTVDKTMRITVINSTVNIEARTIKLYELIENDLLGPLDLQTAAIAPYRGTGACKNATISREDELDAVAGPSEVLPDAAPSGFGTSVTANTENPEQDTTMEEREMRGKRPMYPSSSGFLEDSNHMMKRSKSVDAFSNIAG